MLMLQGHCFHHRALRLRKKLTMIPHIGDVDHRIFVVVLPMTKETLLDRRQKLSHMLKVVVRPMQVNLLWKVVEEY